MTDDYDIEDHEHGHDPDAEAHQDHEASGDQEPKAEVWQDDQPPVDDLMEDDNATVSEEAVGDAAQEEVVETKRKSILLPVTIGIAGILVLGAVLHWQFNREPSRIAAAALHKVSAAVTADATVPRISSLPPADAGVAPRTSLTNTGGEVLPSSAPVAAATPSPAAPPGPSSVAASSAIPLPPLPDETAPVPAPAARVTAVAPVPPQPPMPIAASPLPSAPMAAPSAPAHQTVPDFSNEGVNARLETLSARIDELKKSFDKATERLAQIQAKMQASNQPGVVLSANAPLEDRLTKIEQQVVQLEHEQKTAQLPAESETAMISEAAPVPARKSKHAHTAHKTQKTPSKHVAKTSNKWVLRAATPDEAWVAKNATTPELRHIKVGDVLPGIGRVKAIEQKGDAWSVIGSSGTVH